MWILLVCAGLSLGICLPLFLHYKLIRPLTGAAFKMLGTLCALVPAAIAAIRLDPVCWVFVAALFLHASADYVLEFRFEIGMGLFLLGHICYIIGFLKLFPLSATHLILLIACLVYLAFLMYRNRKRLDKNLPAFVIYGIVLSLMIACGIAGGATTYSIKGVMIMFGAALFFFSDHLLLNRILSGGGKATDWIIMITYYASQLLLGGSCLF